MRKKSFRRTKTHKCKVQKFKLSFKTVKSLRLCTCEMMARNTHLLMSLFRQKKNRFNAKNRTNCASARNFAICKKCAQHTKPYRAKILENSHFVVWACACMTYNADQLCAVSYTDLCSTACLLLSTCFRRGFACIACASRHFLRSVNRFSCSFAQVYRLLRHVSDEVSHASRVRHATSWRLWTASAAALRRRISLAQPCFKRDFVRITWHHSVFWTLWITSAAEAGTYALELKRSKVDITPLHDETWTFGIPITTQDAFYSFRSHIRSCASRIRWSPSGQIQYFFSQSSKNVFDTHSYKTPPVLL